MAYQITVEFILPQTEMISPMFPYKDSFCREQGNKWKRTSVLLM